MMDIATSVMYLFSMSLTGFMGCLFIEVIDRKTDETRTKVEKKLKKFRK